MDLEPAEDCWLKSTNPVENLGKPDHRRGWKQFPIIMLLKKHISISTIEIFLELLASYLQSVSSTTLQTISAIKYFHPYPDIKMFHYRCEVGRLTDFHFVNILVNDKIVYRTLEGGIFCSSLFYIFFVLSLFYYSKYVH